MFGFGKKTKAKPRDFIIGTIANIIDHMLPKDGYEAFSDGYLFVSQDFTSVGWSGGPNPRGAIYSFRVGDIEGASVFLSDDMFGSRAGIERKMFVDMYCGMVHQFLLDNWDEYRKLDYIDRRLA